MPSSPTQRTLAWLRNDGWTAEVVERFNWHTKRRHDLFTFVDILAMREGSGFLAVQATSGSNTAARATKIRECEHAETWLKVGGRIMVVGWRQLAAYRKDGSKAKRKKWTPKVEEITA